MTQPPFREVVQYEQKLFADQREDGIAQGEDTTNGGTQRKRYERIDAKPQEEQPHAPTGNRFRQRHITLSFELKMLAGLPSYL